jgi:hypothetical protein
MFIQSFVYVYRTLFYLFYLRLSPRLRDPFVDRQLELLLGGVGLGARHARRFGGPCAAPSGSCCPGRGGELLWRRGVI